MFIFWAIFFYLILSIDKKEKSSVIDILKKRLAKGEISQEQFESIKTTLKEGN
ncbi:SHOCT domain-containing protein [bacterium]|nr:SHOCT domain-containing protein [bacterium]